MRRLQKEPVFIRALFAVWVVACRYSLRSVEHELPLIWIKWRRRWHLSRVSGEGIFLFGLWKDFGLDVFRRAHLTFALWEVVRAWRYGTSEAEAVYEEVHDAPECHHEHECSDAPEREATCALACTLVARPNDEVPDDVVEEEEKGERKDEGHQSGVYEPHDGDEVALDAVLLLGEREAGCEDESKRDEYLFHTAIIPQVRALSPGGSGEEIDNIFTYVIINM